MVSRKQELKKFLIWFRNGTSFAVTWFLILLLAASCMLNVQALSAALLAKMVALSAGGAFLFCASFTKLFFTHWHFMKRLRFFFLVLSAYQTVGFYWIGLFGESGSALQWGIYGVMVLGFYLGCVVIYQIYAVKKGKAYTRALSEYQKKRGENHG